MKCVRSTMWVAMIATLACLLGACSARRAETEILPWFKMRGTVITWGGFGPGGQQTDFYARHFGFLWQRVDASGASILSGSAMLLTSKHGASVLEQGNFTAVPVCPLNLTVGTPPDIPYIDCLAFADYAMNKSGYGQVTVTRKRFDGSIVFEKTVTSGDRMHRMQSYFPFFYDRSGAPYLLAVAEASLRDNKVPPDCILLTGFGSETHIAARLPDMDQGTCYKPAAWTAQVGSLVDGQAEPYGRQMQKRGTQPSVPSNKIAR